MPRSKMSQRNRYEPPYSAEVLVASLQLARKTGNVERAVEMVHELYALGLFVTFVRPPSSAADATDEQIELDNARNGFSPLPKTLTHRKWVLADASKQSMCM